MSTAEVGTALDRREPVTAKAVAAAENDPGSLIALALREQVPVEVLERLVALHERVSERNAEVALANALAAFQAECPAIPRVSTAEVKKNGIKQYEYKFAPLDEIVRVIRPHLTAHGFSYVHDAVVTNQGVTVTCTLQHVMGAKRVATFSGPIDTSGGKNPIQQVASARSYGRRYSLVDVLGLITEDDDDARSVGERDSGPITAEQLNELVTLIDAADVDTPRFCAFLKVDALKDLPENRFDEAKAALLQKQRRRA